MPPGGSNAIKTFRNRHGYARWNFGFEPRSNSPAARPWTAGFRGRDVPARRSALDGRLQPARRSQSEPGISIEPAHDVSHDAQKPDRGGLGGPIPIHPGRAGMAQFP